jgi:hypothetical protein
MVAAASGSLVRVAMPASSPPQRTGGRPRDYRQCAACRLRPCTRGPRRYWAAVVHLYGRGKGRPPVSASG